VSQGLPPEVSKLLTDDVCGKRLKELAAYVKRHAPDIPFTEDMLGKLKRARDYRRKVNKRQSGIDPANRRCFGGLVEFVRRFSKEVVTAAEDFDEDSIYVFGEHRIVPHTDKDKKDICITMSSENLLLNAYRQWAAGLPPFVAIDYTHRLTLEKVACLPIGTVDLAQKFHVIAYGVCQHERITDYSLVLKNVRDEVNAVVAKYASEGKRV
jgi:hypothetical protein